MYNVNGASYELKEITFFNIPYMSYVMEVVEHRGNYITIMAYFRCSIDEVASKAKCIME